MTSHAHNNDDEDRPKRRPRYGGTHPRRFEQRYKELDPDSYPEIQEHVRAQGRTPAGSHVPVMVEEILAAMNPGAGDIVVDCTVGYGGHAAEFLKRIGPAGRLIGLDVDALQIQRTAQRLGGTIHDDTIRTDTSDPPRISLHRSHFAGIGKVLAQERLEACDIILADLGASSMQFDDPARGFSYKHDGPLDMRMDNRLPITAADLLATLSADELSAKLLELADEPNHESIAQAIARQRDVQPITRTRQLARLIVAAQCDSRNDAPASVGELHPAARTFQALRMLVNDETGGLEQLLRVVPYCLRPGGRIGVVGFHSGEHRRVQSAFTEGLRAGVYAEISEEPIRPTPQEIAANPRSRSAKLHWARTNETL